jgi:N utilization substance protein A
MATKKKAKKTKKSKKAAAPRKAKKAVKKPKVTKKARVTKNVNALAKTAAKAKPAPRRTRGRASAGEVVEYGPERGLGAFSAGQSGDLQGLRGSLRGGSESAEELLEEGQTFEAEAVAGVEDAEDPDVSEVRTHQFPEDDVPEEYQDKD